VFACGGLLRHIKLGYSLAKTSSTDYDSTQTSLITPVHRVYIGVMYPHERVGNGYMWGWYEEIQ